MPPAPIDQMSLSNKHKRFLRGLSHKLQPVVSIADKGLSVTVREELETALEFHELIKVKIRCDRGKRAKIIGKICGDFQSEMIHSIGQVACFYRMNAKKPKIELPD